MFYFLGIDIICKTKIFLSVVKNQQLLIFYWIFIVFWAGGSNILYCALIKNQVLYSWCLFYYWQLLWNRLYPCSMYIEVPYHLLCVDVKSCLPIWKCLVYFNFFFYLIKIVMLILKKFWLFLFPERQLMDNLSNWFLLI